jgi:hypothetical protein
LITFLEILETFWIELTAKESNILALTLVSVLFLITFFLPDE